MYAQGLAKRSKEREVVVDVLGACSDSPMVARSKNTTKKKDTELF